MINNNHWPTRTEKCFDDFLEFNYSLNSPELLLDGLTKLTISDHLPLKQSIYLNSLFCKATISYHKIEEGFWILSTEVDVKQDIVIKSKYDKKLSNDYYLLTFSVLDSKFTFNDLQNVDFISSCWTFSKPGTEVTTPFYRNTTSHSFTLAVTKQWTNKAFMPGSISYQQTIENFLNSEKGFFSGMPITPKTHSLIKKITKTWKTEYNMNKQVDATNLKKDCLKLFIDFFNNSFERNRIEDNVSLKNSDYQIVFEAEKIILDNLYLPFIGIDYIAREVRISPTKLKANFKEVFGISILQYHKEKNMLLAMQLIQNSNIMIKNIAAVTGYQNTSRFSRNFKKRFGKLPYKVR